jgi:hypothetical protein
VSRLDQFAGDEAGHKAMSLSIRRIVINKNIVCVLARFREALQ